MLEVFLSKIVLRPVYGFTTVHGSAVLVDSDRFAVAEVEGCIDICRSSLRGYSLSGSLCIRGAG